MSAEISFTNSYPKQYKNLLAKEIDMPVMKGADMINTTKLTSNNAVAFGTNYVIRLNQLQAVSNYIREVVPFRVPLNVGNGAAAFTVTPSAAIVAGTSFDLTITIPLPILPRCNAVNLISDSVTTTLGSNTSTAPNISQNLTQLMLYGYDEDDQKHDYYNQSSLELFAYAPRVDLQTSPPAFKAPYSANLNNLKLSALRGPYVNAAQATHDNQGNMNTGIVPNSFVISGENITLSATNDITVSAPVFTYDWQYVTLTYTISNKTAADAATVLSLPANAKINIDFDCIAPLFNGKFANTLEQENYLFNLNQIIIQKNVVPNILQCATIPMYSARTLNIAAPAGPDDNKVTSAAPLTFGIVYCTTTYPAAGNLALAGAISLNVGDAVCRDTPYVYYKTLTFQNAEAVIPKSFSMCTKNYSVFQPQSVGSSLAPFATFNFTSQTMVLPTPPSSIYIWFGFQNTNMSYEQSCVLPQALITNIQSIVLAGRVICSGLGDSYAVHNELMCNSRKSLAEVGFCRLAQQQVGMCGSILRIRPDQYQGDYCVGLQNSQLTLQFNLTIQNINETVTFAANQLNCYILAVQDEILTFDNGTATSSLTFIDSEVLKEVRSSEASLHNVDSVMLGGAWYNDLWDGIKDVGKFAWDNKDALVKAAELLGFGEEEKSEGGKVMSKKDAERALMRRILKK